MKFELLLPMMVAAHMKIFYPKPRSTNELASLTGPCGKNFNSPVPGRRTVINANDFQMKIQVADSDASVVINAGFGLDPFEFPWQLTTFNASLQNINVPLNLTIIGDLRNGDPLTLQVIESSEDGVKYGCSDVTISGLQ